jgi:DNA (cytosine-5)-methyltransferase 1
VNYYNEFDVKAAAWLRELINLKLLPQGEVDTRSIKDVRADDLRGFTQCHFFAGIGGWSRALQLAGWPEDKPVWTGSCPCQCFSLAGEGKGANDERDLWPVFFELIKACRPEFVFGEQVEAAIKHGWLDRVCANMETENYAVGAVVLGAHSLGAPHLRQRLYWGATRMAEDSASIGRGGRSNANSTGQRREIQAQGLGNDGSLSDSEYKQYQMRISDSRIDPEAKGSRETTEFAGYSSFEFMGDTEGNKQFRNSERSNGGESAGRSSRDIGMADSCQKGLQGYPGDGGRIFKSGWISQNSTRSTSESSISGFSPWSDFGLVYCRDNKVRRVPAESLLLSVADGLSEGVDAIRYCGILEAERGFTICKKEEEIGRTMLLKGYGNAIVPQVAAEFIMAFEEEVK